MYDLISMRTCICWCILLFCLSKGCVLRRACDDNLNTQEACGPSLSLHKGIYTFIRPALGTSGLRGVLRAYQVLGQRMDEFIFDIIKRFGCDLEAISERFVCTDTGVEFCSRLGAQKPGQLRQRRTCLGKCRLPNKVVQRLTYLVDVKTLFGEHSVTCVRRSHVGERDKCCFASPYVNGWCVYVARDTKIESNMCCLRLAWRRLYGQMTCFIDVNGWSTLQIDEH